MLIYKEAAFWIVAYTVFCIIISTSNGLDKIVLRCPCNKTQWEHRSQQFSCQDKAYTCILTRNESLMEVCMHRIEIGSTEDGCPYIDYRQGGESIIGAPLTPCSFNGCPPLDHPSYFLSELFKYPLCYVPTKDRIKMSHPGYIEKFCLRQGKEEDHENTLLKKETSKERFPWWFTLIIVLVIVLAIGLILAVTVIIRKRRKHRRFKQEVEGLSLTPVMEYNNYATGLALSHYTGYLKSLLPVFQDELRKRETFKSHPENTFEKWIMLCPKSAKSTNIADNQYISIADEFTILGTYFKINIYEIKKDGKCWYCCMQYPSALMSLGKHTDMLSPATVALEVERFTYYMQSILDHEQNSECQDKAVTILYDDEDEENLQLAEIVLKHIDKETKEKEARTYGNNNNVCLLRTKAQLKDGKGGKYTNLLKRLKALEGQTVMDASVDDKPIALKALNSCYWTVVFLLNDKCLTTAPWLIPVLSKLVQDGKCRIIMLVSDESAERLAKCIPWSISIDVDKEVHVFEKVENTILGKTVSNTTDIPVGDVSFGLTWAFYVNYLQHVTPDLLQRMEKKTAEKSFREQIGNMPVKASKFLWQIVPHSCAHYPSLKDLDSRLSGPFTVEPLRKPLHGQQRVFPAYLYHFQARNTNFLFLGEVFSPCKALKAMKESDIVNISEKQFKKLRGKMVDQMKSLLTAFSSDGTNEIQTKILDYNDSTKEHLSELLMKEIDKERKENETYQNCEEGRKETTYNDDAENEEKRPLA